MAILERLAARLLALAAASCAPMEEPRTCIPGRTQACECDEGLVGVQSCRADGKGFGVCGGCTASAVTPFTDVARDVGLAYLEAAPLDGVTPCVVPGYCEMNLLTGGVAIGDYDGDGGPDVFVSRLGATPLLFRNRGDGRFDDVTAAAGLALAANWNGAAWGDLDNDGDLDLMAQTIGKGRHYLFINQGDGTFVDDAVARGVAFDNGISKLGMSVSVGDFDRDGWLDLHLTEWSIKLGPQAVDPKIPAHIRLMRNRGASAPGHFEDVTVALGAVIDPPDELGNRPTMYGYGSAIADFDGDDWPELALSGDFGTSRFLWNEGGTFAERTRDAGVGRDAFGMGSAIADLDGDGQLDWYVTSISTLPNCQATNDCGHGEWGNRLYRYAGGRLFEDVGYDWRLHDGFWGWGAAMFDFDHDGDLDVVQTNGIAYPIVQPGSFYAHDQDRFWRNDGGTFVEAASALGLVDLRRGKGLALFDFDRDGDLDVFVVRNASEPSLYRNDVAKGHWLKVRVLTDSGRDAIGARVRVTLKKGETSRVAMVGVATNFLGQSEPTVHFGLGDHGGHVDEVEVHWHDSGKTRVLSSVPVDDLLVVDP